MNGFQISTGAVVRTHSVNKWCEQSNGFASLVAESLARHQRGDWGNLDPDDTHANDRAAVLGERILSAYALPDRLAAITGCDKVWIITEADRSATTILWPSEY